MAILSFIQLVSLIIIVGGTITIGALAAPTLFSNLSRQEAGSVMIDLFTKFDKWIKFSALSLLAAKLIELIAAQKMNFMIESGTGEEIVKTLNTPMLTNLLLVLLIVAVSLYISFKLSPAVTDSYENDTAEFSKLHNQSEMLHKVNFVLGLVLLFSYA